MKILVIGDIHLGIYKGDISLKLSTSNINHIRKVYNSTNPDCVIFLGDIFHKPRLEPEFLVIFNDLIHDIQCQIYLLTGNHDCKDLYKGNLLKAFRRKDIAIIDKIYQENDMVFIPYIHNLDQLRQILSDLYCTYIFTHNNIGYNLNFEHIHLNIISDTCLVFNGHIHSGYIRSNFVNVGSVSSLDFSFDIQSVGIVLLDTTDRTIREYPNQNIYFCTILDIGDIDKFTKIADYMEFIALRYDITYEDEVKSICNVYNIDIIRPVLIKQLHNTIPVKKDIIPDPYDIDLEQTFIQYMKQNYNLDVTKYIVGG